MEDGNYLLVENATIQKYKRKRRDALLFDYLAPIIHGRCYFVPILGE